MAALQNQLLLVREKLQLLLKQHSNALKEVQLLAKENDSLRKQLELKTAQTLHLNQKFDAINVTSIDISAEAKKDLEKRINGYLKEIDKCLAMLNT